MRIALDIDGTITRHPRFFSVVSKALIAAGHNVYVISYREDREFAEQDLALYDVVFDELVVPTEEEWQRSEGETWRQEIGQWKAEVCRRLSIDVLFDDMPEVINALGEDTVAFMAVNRSLGNVGYGHSDS